MAPEARIIFPQGLKKDDISQFTYRMGGILVEFSETFPVKTTAITRDTFTQFVNGSIQNTTDNRDIFARLRSLPRDIQEKIMKNFYTTAVEDFPYGREVGRELVRINNIRWFAPDENTEPEFIKDCVNIYTDRIYADGLNVRVIKNDWSLLRSQEALGIKLDDMMEEKQARILVFDATRKDKERTIASNHVVHTVGDMVFNSNLLRQGYLEQKVSAQYFATNYIEWLIFQDKMKERGYKKGNPYEPMLEIFEKGGYPLGIYLKEGKKYYVVFIPPVNKSPLSNNS